MRIMRAENKKQLDMRIDEKITEGYRVVEQGEESAKLKQKDYGGALAHLIIFLLFGWYTFFGANIVYAIYKYYVGADELLIKIEK